MRDFGAIVEAVDFARNNASAARISGWVSDQTRGKVTNLVPSDALDSLTRIVLTHAVYLKVAKFVRFSIAVAKNESGNAALTTYALAQRLSKRPETAHLAPHVAAMRRVLGRGKSRAAARRRTTPPTPATPALSSAPTDELS